VALGAAIQCLQEIGWETIVRQEEELTGYALEKLAAIPGIRVYGESDPTRTAQRLGVISFRLRDLHHGLVSEVLSNEWGIGTRSGRFCAHPYVRSLLNADRNDSFAAPSVPAGSECADTAGLVRISFGLYNTREEVDTLCDALASIAWGRARTRYRWDGARGFVPADGTTPRFDRFFAL
jgi:selenocysteine lyase/cysteine desulfurase